MEKRGNWLSTFWKDSLLNKLITINVMVFFLVNLVALFMLWFQVDDMLVYGAKGGYTSKFTYWLAASSSMMETLTHPWTVITYMFLHQGLWHLLFNMIFLFFAGQIFVRFLGERRLLSMYIFGGLSGLGLYMLAYNLIPYFHTEAGIPIMGASASVMAIFIAVAAYKPEMPVRLPLLGSVRLKYIAIFYLVMDFANIKSGINAGGHIAHLGGALYGFYSIYLLRRGKDILYDLRPLVASIASIFSFKRKLKVDYRSDNIHRRPQSDYEYNYNKKQTEKKVDEILDKISKSGYDSLSKAEKDFLFKQSSKNQN